MNDREKFLHAEKIANELVETLNKLKQEIESYKTAGAALNDVKLKLSELTNNNKHIAEQMLQIIKTIVEIGGPEILDSINQNNTRLDIQKSELTLHKKLIFLIVIIVTINLSALVYMLLA